MPRLGRKALLATVALLLSPLAHAGFPLRVLTYNIWGLPAPADHAEWRYGEIAKRVSQYDIVAFEETWSSKTDVVWKIPSHPYHAFGGQAHGLVGGSGLIVISKYPIIESHFEKYTDCADLECTAGKGALMFRVEVRPGVELDCYATHTNAWQDQSLVRTGQLLQLVGMIENYSIGRPVLILGDFNSEYRSTNYDEFKGNLFLHDSYQEYVDSRPDATPSERDGFSFDINRNPWATPSISHEDHPQRLDYVFYRDTYELRMRVTESGLAFTEPVREDKPLSDHYGVTTLFDLQPVVE
jgi:endonuclease/exonuclease/phosphatase family metal-dependent hydrolase